MTPSTDSLCGDPLYTQLKEHVVGSTGLTYYDDRDSDLAQRISRRLSSLQMEDCGSYLELLKDPLRGPSELDALIAEITIGETYFFRHQEHFDSLRDLVLPDLLARNQSRRSLRVWSAGCANGPEPYSLSILLKREFSYQLAGWAVTILGTDINRRSLARGREGKFEEWALRSMSESLRRDCFQAEGKLWSLQPRYKEWVSFQYHNLVEDHSPSLVNNLYAFDLIICRNVMLYFGAALMQRMIQKFYDSLIPGGWLLVGPTDPNMTFFRSFRTVNTPGATLYQKPFSLAPLNAGVAPIGPLPPLPPASPADIPPLPAPPSGTAEPTLADVRFHADRGAWESAADCCDELLKKDALNSAAHFYRALILDQMRKPAEAERALRRGIYLDRRSVLPHYYLGLFLQSKGDLRQAARSFENTLELLGARNDAEILLDGDGITVAEVRKLARMNLDILRERA